MRRCNTCTLLRKNRLSAVDRGPSSQLVSFTACSGGDSRTHSLDVALPLHNLAAAAACAGLPDLGFRLLKRCEEFMRIEVPPSHPRCELVAHNLTSLRCRGARLAVGV